MFDSKSYMKEYHKTHKEEAKAYKELHREEFRASNRKYMEKYRKIYKEKVKLSRKKHYQLYKEKLNSASRKYWITHKEKYKYRNKQYYQIHKEKIKFRSKEYRNNPNNKEKIRLCLGNWRKTPKGKLVSKIHSINYKNKTKDLTLKTIQVVYEDNIKKYGTLTCYLCLLSIPFGKDHLEHKMPLSRGGTNARENLDIACQCCNLRKNNKTETEFRLLYLQNLQKQLSAGQING